MVILFETLSLMVFDLTSLKDPKDRRHRTESFRAASNENGHHRPLHWIVRSTPSYTVVTMKFFAPLIALVSCLTAVQAGRYVTAMVVGDPRRHFLVAVGSYARPPLTNHAHVHTSLPHTVTWRRLRTRSSSMSRLKARRMAAGSSLASLATRSPRR